MTEQEIDHNDNENLDQYCSSYFYAMVNPAMPEYIKLGITSRTIEYRQQELSQSTSVPLPFKILALAHVANASILESLALRLFDKQRTPGKEFVKASEEEILSLFGILEFTGVRVEYPEVDCLRNTAAATVVQGAPSKTEFDDARVANWMREFTAKNGHKPAMPDAQEAFPSMARTTLWRRMRAAS